MSERTLRILCCVIVITSQFISIYGKRENFIIQNKKTGLILEGAHGLHMNYWQNDDSQLWNVVPSRKPGYFVIVNAANRKAVTYRKNGINFQKFKLTTNGETLIQVEHHPNAFLVGGASISFFGPRQRDESDTWLIMPEVLSVEVV